MPVRPKKDGGKTAGHDGTADVATSSRGDLHQQYLLEKERLRRRRHEGMDDRPTGSEHEPRKRHRDDPSGRSTPQIPDDPPQYRRSIFATAAHAWWIATIRRPVPASDISHHEQERSFRRRWERSTRGEQSCRAVRAASPAPYRRSSSGESPVSAWRPGSPVDDRRLPDQCAVRARNDQTRTYQGGELYPGVREEGHGIGH